jgi:hypothetical protein
MSDGDERERMQVDDGLLFIRMEIRDSIFRRIILTITTFLYWSRVI